MTLKLGRRSSSVMLSQARSESQAGPGLGGCWERSSTCPPFKKNCHSSPFTWEADCKMRTHICSDSSSLCRSNKPLRHSTTACISQGLVAISVIMGSCQCLLVWVTALPAVFQLMASQHLHPVSATSVL